jgi:hypothetical protein
LLDFYRAFTAAWDRWLVLTRLNRELAGTLVSALTASAILAPSAWAEPPGSGGFDWSSAGISAAALAGLLIVSIAVVIGVRHDKNRKGRETK